MIRQILLSLALVTLCHALEADQSARVYRPFAEERAEQRVSRQADRFYVNRRPIILERPGYDISGSDDYPVVLTPRQAFQNTLDSRLSYRPEPLVSPFRKESLQSPRPVITIGPQAQLAYGKPYVRVPYQQERLPLISPTRDPYEISRPPLRAPIAASRRPIIKAVRPEYSAVPQREFGPFGQSGPFSKYPEYEPELISEVAFPDNVNTPYAPKYNNYIPSLYFRHDTNPTTGEYAVEYETANGIYQKENGYTKRTGGYNPITRAYEEKATPVKTGRVAWTSPEGIRFSYEYIADENGYRPTPLIQSRT